MKIKEKFSQMSSWEIGGVIAFVISLIGVIYFNLSDLRLSMDPDFAITVYHGREMVKNGTLVLKDWYGTTSMEYDNTLLFAVPLSLLTGDVLNAVGISDLIMVFLYLIAIWDILHIFKVGYGLRFWILAAIITPYSYGWLDYFKMLFFAHANYCVKALIPILLILNILIFDSDRSDMDTLPHCKKIFYLALYLVMLFVTSVSTGIYAFVCCVVPVFMFEVANAWRRADNRKIKTEWPVWLGSFLCMVVGVLIFKKIFAGQEKIANLVTYERFADGLRAVFVGVFQVFGGLIDDEVPVYSATGIYYCLKLILALMVMITIIMIIVGWFRRTPKSEYLILFAVVMPFNMLILMLGDIRGGNTYIPYRYLLVGVPVILVAVAIMLQGWLNTLNNKQIAALMECIIILTLFIIAGNLKTTHDNMMNMDYVVEMTDYFKALDADTVFIVNNQEKALNCKGADETRKYVAYNSETGALELHLNYFYKDMSFDAYQGRNVIAIPKRNTLTELVPEDIAQHYEYVGDVRGMDCYVADEVYFK